MLHVAAFYLQITGGKRRAFLMALTKLWQLPNIKKHSSIRLPTSSPRSWPEVLQNVCQMTAQLLCYFVPLTSVPGNLQP